MGSKLLEDYVEPAEGRLGGATLGGCSGDLRHFDEEPGGDMSSWCLKEDPCQFVSMSAPETACAANNSHGFGSSGLSPCSAG